MLGYICKYAPVEVFQSMGTQMERIEPDVTNFNQAEIRMHPNICTACTPISAALPKESWKKS